MPKVWNVGNTTVRNPKRIENALKVFVEEGFSGNAKGSEVEARLHGKLKERQVLEFDGEASDWNGRKWRAAFYQLGFISYEKYSIDDSRLSTEQLFDRISNKEITLPYQVTVAGQKLISASRVPEIEEVYTRQFACYELPNSLETGFPDGSLKPFILFIQVLLLLDQKNLSGLTKLETGLFIQKFQNHTSNLHKDIVDDIILFRDELSKCKTPKEQKDLKKKYLNELGEFSGINPLSVAGDYADTTFRYFSLSGLFTRVGDTLVIRNNKKEFAKKLVSDEPKFIYKTNPIEYFKHFYSNSYQIPSDIKEFALLEIENLKTGIRDKQNPLLTVANSISSTSDLNEIKSVRYQLIEYNNWEREEDFANEQQSDEAVKEILAYLSVLNNETVSNPPDIDDKPAYLEWAVWRSFLAIDEIVGEVHKTRRFPVDEDFLPRNTAPGHGSDLIFEFESYVLVVEVTLTVSHRQMAVESEPVRRHTVQYKQEYPDKDVYCLFIAPSVDNNVAETFRIGVWYKADDEEFVNIVPMSLSDFIGTISILLKKKYHNSDFRTLLDRCLANRNVRAPQWKKSISKEVNEWSKRIVLSK